MIVMMTSFINYQDASGDLRVIGYHGEGWLVRLFTRMVWQAPVMCLMLHPFIYLGAWSLWL